jgi:hypothetical protein
MPTTDMRSIFKTVLEAHLNAPRDATDSIIFSNSSTAMPLHGMLAQLSSNSNDLNRNRTELLLILVIGSL